MKQTRGIKFLEKSCTYQWFYLGHKAVNLQSGCLKMTCSPHVMVVFSGWWIICVGGLHVMVHWRSNTKKIIFITNLALMNYS